MKESSGAQEGLGTDRCPRDGRPEVAECRARGVQLTAGVADGDRAMGTTRPGRTAAVRPS